MIKICLKTLNGHFLIATANDTISATPDGVGDWELFQVLQPDGKAATSINHNDRIVLRTHFGKFVRALNGGGGALGVAEQIQTWEVFRIEKISGKGAVAHSDRVTLRASDGRHFIMAVNAGGGVVSAESTNRLEWETFTLQYWNSNLVHIISHNNHFLHAVNGGGREIMANSDTPVTRETFRLINRTRATGLSSGDSIAIQTWNGKFLSASGGGGSTVSANQNRAATFETFTITKPGGGVINLGDRVYFQMSNRIHFLMALNGGGNIINAMASLSREWETFTIVAAQNLPISFALTPTVIDTVSNPFRMRPPRITGAKKIIALMFGFQDSLADDSITQADFQNFIFGSTNSLKSWFEKNSYGAMTIEGVAYGPFNVPWAYNTNPVIETNAYYNGILTAANSEFSLSEFDTDGNNMVGSDDVMFLLMDCSGSYGAAQSGTSTFNFRGISYSGNHLIVGLYPQGGLEQGVRQLNQVFGTVAHELCHMLLGFPDRYYAPFPPRADVDATGTVPTNRARYRIEFIGTGVNQVRIKTADDSYWVPDGTTDSLLNGDGIATNPNTIFELSRASGSGTTIQHLDRIRIRSRFLTRYVKAKWGGGDVVSVSELVPSTSEIFIIERVLSDGMLMNNDEVFFKTTDDNPFGISYYLVTQPFNPSGLNARHNDPATLARGWWTDWNFSGAGNGVGGAYDLMDNDKKKGLMSAYDRLKRGWIAPRVLTPQNKACYVLRPSIDFAEAIVLWDPFFPDEWYIIENRQNRVNEDVIPSSGLIITWVNENPAYWLSWNRPNDITQVFPSVISAANPSLPPNAHVQPMLQSGAFYKRSERNTAFISDEVGLPKGNGQASRFFLAVQTLTGGRMAFCIK